MCEAAISHISHHSAMLILFTLHSKIGISFTFLPILRQQTGRTDRYLQMNPIEFENKKKPVVIPDLRKTIHWFERIYGIYPNSIRKKTPKDMNSYSLLNLDQLWPKISPQTDSSWSCQRVADKAQYYFFSHGWRGSPTMSLECNYKRE